MCLLVSWTHPWRWFDSRGRSCSCRPRHATVVSDRRVEIGWPGCTLRYRVDVRSTVTVVFESGTRNVARSCEGLQAAMKGMVVAMTVQMNFGVIMTYRRVTLKSTITPTGFSSAHRIIVVFFGGGETFVQ